MHWLLRIQRAFEIPDVFTFDHAMELVAIRADHPNLMDFHGNTHDIVGRLVMRLVIEGEKGNLDPWMLDEEESLRISSADSSSVLYGVSQGVCDEFQVQDFARSSAISVLTQTGKIILERVRESILAYPYGDASGQYFALDC